jgi:integrase
MVEWVCCQQMLTDLMIKRLKPTLKPFKVSDGRGLHLLISIVGSKQWRISYRFDGRQKLLSLGPYPDVSLAEARERVAEVKKTLRQGGDPSLRPISGDTFAMVADELIQRKKERGFAKTTIETNEWLLGMAKEAFGQRPVSAISPQEVLTLLRTIESSGRIETARRLRALVGGVFRFAVTTARAASDPTLLLKDALHTVTTKHHPAITEPRKLGALLVDIDEYEGWPTIKGALIFASLVFARPAEIRGARWRDIVGATWKVPADQMKMKRPHDVPLSVQALRLIESMKPFGGGDYIFPSIRSWRKPLSENTLNSALRRIGYSKLEHTTHGFRTTASTLLNEKGYVNDVIETQLSHLDEDKVRRAYNRALYWPERVKMMQEWADYLDTLKKQAII